MLVRDTAATLSSLEAGHRGWFWFCPELPDSEPVFLLTSLRADPKMALLEGMARQVQVPVGVLPQRGMVSVGENGRLSLAAALASMDGLRRLAAWVCLHAAAHPGLSRARGAAMFQLGQNGTVHAIFEDDALWGALPELPAPGSAAASAALIQAMSPGESAWFWLTARGPGGGPLLQATPLRDDPDGEVFQRRLQDLRLRFPDAERSMVGVMQKMGDGTLTLTTRDSILGSERLLAGFPGGLFAGARVVQVEGQRFTSIRRVESGPDLGALVSAIAAMSPGDSAWFQLSQTLQVVAEREQVAREDGALRGRIRLHPKGWVELRVRERGAAVLPALIPWVQRHQGRWPGLARLRGARVVERGADGEITARFRDDRAWATITPEEA